MSAYLTLKKQAETETIVQKSRFIGFAAPVSSAEEALALLDTKKKNSRDASHHCFAYVIGQNKGIMRYSDDNEPSGTAGKPIAEVMLAKDVTDCIVIVTRYFGGILLGAGGLTRAYAHAAAQAMDAAEICTMHETVRFHLQVAYPLWGRVEHAIKSLPIHMESTEYLEAVKLSAVCRIADEAAVARQFMQMTDGKAVPQRDGDPFFHPWSI